MPPSSVAAAALLAALLFVPPLSAHHRVRASAVAASSTSQAGAPTTAVGSSCSSSSSDAYSCGPANSHGQDSINVCVDGRWAKLLDCDAGGMTACGSLAGMPLCVSRSAAAARSPLASAQPSKNAAAGAQRSRLASTKRVVAAAPAAVAASATPPRAAVAAARSKGRITAAGRPAKDAHAAAFDAAVASTLNGPKAPAARPRKSRTSKSLTVSQSSPKSRYKSGSAVSPVVWQGQSGSGADGSGDGSSTGDDTAVSDTSTAVDDTASTSAATGSSDTVDPSTPYGAQGLTACQYNMLLQITSVFETGTTTLNYGTCEDINDGNGYSAGCIQFTTNSGSALAVVQDYLNTNPSSNLAGYVSGLQSVQGSGDTSAISGFCDAWSAAASSDPSGFGASQMKIAAQNYLAPNAGLVSQLGLKTATGVGQIMDCAIQL
ncbi:hypothetical protein HK405_014641, partial [Cladochytrium tenue]